MAHSATPTQGAASFRSVTLLATGKGGAYAEYHTGGDRSHGVAVHVASPPDKKRILAHHFPLLSVAGF